MCSGQKFQMSVFFSSNSSGWQTIDSIHTHESADRTYTERDSVSNLLNMDKFYNERYKLRRCQRKWQWNHRSASEERGLPSIFLSTSNSWVQRLLLHLNQYHSFELHWRKHLIHLIKSTFLIRWLMKLFTISLKRKKMLLSVFFLSLNWQNKKKKKMKDHVLFNFIAKVWWEFIVPLWLN